jgi:hypothetical protein
MLAAAAKLCFNSIWVSTISEYPDCFLHCFSSTYTALIIISDLIASEREPGLKL